MAARALSVLVVAALLVACVDRAVGDPVDGGIVVDSDAASSFDGAALPPGETAYGVVGLSHEDDGPGNSDHRAMLVAAFTLEPLATELPQRPLWEVAYQETVITLDGVSCDVYQCDTCMMDLIAPIPMVDAGPVHANAIGAEVGLTSTFDSESYSWGSVSGVPGDPEWPTWLGDTPVEVILGGDGNSWMSAFARELILPAVPASPQLDTEPVQVWPSPEGHYRITWAAVEADHVQVSFSALWTEWGINTTICHPEPGVTEMLTPWPALSGGGQSTLSVSISATNWTTASLPGAEMILATIRGRSGLVSFRSE